MYRISSYCSQKFKIHLAQKIKYIYLHINLKSPGTLLPWATAPVAPP